MLQSDPISLVESLRNQGKLIWFPCDGDGGYSVAVFVRSEMPDDLIAHCRDEEFVPRLFVRGIGFFGGMECMFKHDSSFVKKYPAMCEQVSIPEGTYSARIYHTDIPESLYESWLLSQAGTKAKRLWDIHGYIAACAVASMILSLVAFFALTWTARFCVMAVALAFVLGAVLMSRTDWYKRVARARDAFEKAYPSYVVHLE